MLVKQNHFNINFSGAFRFKQTEIKAQMEIPKLFTQGRQIFSDILEKGDKVFVIRDNYDKRIGKYILDNNIKDFEYYPDINTKCGLDDEKPNLLLELIKQRKSRLITTIDEMVEVVSTQKRAPKKPNVIKELNKVANALRLNIENPKIKTDKHSTIVRDEDKKRTLELITANKGTTYVYLQPDSLNENSLRYIIDGQGKIVKSFDTPKDIHKFYKLFRELKEKEVNIFTN